MADLGVDVSVQTNKPFERSNNLLLATTPHSYKGYDSEVVIVAAVDQFKAKEKGVLAHALYVAMTRARSILTMFSQSMKNQHAQRLYGVLEECLDQLEERPNVDSQISAQDDMVELLGRIGREHKNWLRGLWSTHGISQEPIITKKGEIIAEPLFQVTVAGCVYACFGNEQPRQRTLRRLEDSKVKILGVGQSVTDASK